MEQAQKNLWKVFFFGDVETNLRIVPLTQFPKEGWNFLRQASLFKIFNLKSSPDFEQEIMSNNLRLDFGLVLYMS